MTGDAIGAFSGESSRQVSIDPLIQRLEREEFDLIAIGRPLLADPLWAAKVLRGDYAQLCDFTPAALQELI